MGGSRLGRVARLMVVVSLCGVMLASFTDANGQASQLFISGTVFSTTSQRIGGAFVTVNGVRARADKDGNYSAKVAPATQIVALAWAPGYAQTVQFFHATGGGPLTGSVIVSFRGPLALHSALTNPLYGASLSHLPITTAADVASITIAGTSARGISSTMYVIVPGGRVKTYSLHVSGSRFSAVLPFGRAGAYTIGLYSTVGLPIFSVIVFHGVSPSPPPTPNYSPDPSGSAAHLATFAQKRMNKTRTKTGLKKLFTNKRLASAAAAHTADMLKNNYFLIHPHIGSDGSTPQQRMRRAGVHIKAGNEVIGSGKTVRLAIYQIVQDPFHRALVLGNYTWIGVAVQRGPDGQMYITADLAR